MAERVLIVEDDREVREAVADYLTSHGYTCSQAPDGKAMRAAIAEAAPDLVLLDLRLPGEDGLSLARWLRGNHQVAIIMVTAAGGGVGPGGRLQGGGGEYLAQPLDL